MTLRNQPRPLYAIAAAIFTLTVGLFASLAATTLTIVREIGFSESAAWWLFHDPLASVRWLAASDRAYLESFRTHHPFRPHVAAQLGHFHVVLLHGLYATAAAALIAYAVGVFVHRRARTTRGLPRIADRDRGFVLHLGISTGKLLRLGHAAGISARQRITLAGKSAAENIVIYGGTGAGKTVCLFNRILKQALDQDCGILAFDVKGDANADLYELARSANRSVTTIGPGDRSLNILEGLTPEMASSFLKSAMILAGNSGEGAAFWVDHATELSRNALGMLAHFPEHYSLFGLFEYLFVDEFRTSFHERIAKHFDGLVAEESPEVERLRTYMLYEERVFEPLDHRTKSGILAQLSTVLSPFTMPELRYAFCEKNEENVDIRDVIEGEVFLVRLPIQVYGLGAKTALTLIKLRFFNVMERRRVERSWDQKRYVVFLCDEYQEIVSVANTGFSDLNFWDKSRSAKCIGVISAQGYASFRAAIGSEALARAMLQNFRHRIVFRTEDEETIKQAVYLVGHTEIERESTSRSRSSGKGGRTSRSTNRTPEIRQIIDPQTVRQLRFGEALALLSIDGQSYDDVIRTEPLFVQPPHERASRLALRSAKPAASRTVSPPALASAPAAAPETPSVVPPIVPVAPPAAVAPVVAEVAPPTPAVASPSAVGPLQARPSIRTHKRPNAPSGAGTQVPR